MHDSGDESPVSSTWRQMRRRAASPMRSSLARYAGASRRGYSIWAMTSAAWARPVPGAFEAATSASTRSLRMVRAQLLERSQRKRAEAVHDQLGAVELGRRVAVCHSYTS